MVKRVVFDLNVDVVKEFKKKAVEEDKPMRKIIEDFMREYVKGDKDASRTKNTNS